MDPKSPVATCVKLTTSNLGRAGVYDGRKVKGIAFSGSHQLIPGFFKSTGDCYYLVLLQLVKFQSSPPLV